MGKLRLGEKRWLTVSLTMLVAELGFEIRSLIPELTPLTTATLPKLLGEPGTLGMCERGGICVASRGFSLERSAGKK